MSDSFAWRDRITGEEKQMRLLGHYVLARKCEENADNFLVGPAGAVDVPEKFKRLGEVMAESRCKKTMLWGCEVLAVGPDVGKLRDKKFKAKWRCPSLVYRGSGTKYLIPVNSVCELRVGDIIILPESSESQMMWRGVTGSPWDLIVDECEIIAIIR